MSIKKLERFIWYEVLEIWEDRDDLEDELYGEIMFVGINLLLM